MSVFVWPIILGCAGVIFGWAAMTTVRHFRKKRGREKKSHWVKIQTRMEIEQSIRRLHEYWHKVKPDEGNNVHFRKVNALKRMERIELPQLSHRLGEGPTLQLDGVLNKEEKEGILSFYKGFGVIEAIHADLKRLEFTKGSLREVAKLFDRFEKEITGVLQRDNPIKE